MKCLNQCDYPGENGEPCRCQKDAQKEHNTDPVIEEWLETRQIIADFLKELNPCMTEEAYLHNAAAIIARLAQANILTQKVKP